VISGSRTRSGSTAASPFSDGCRSRPVKSGGAYVFGPCTIPAADSRPFVSGSEVTVRSMTAPDLVEGSGAGGAGCWASSRYSASPGPTSIEIRMIGVDHGQLPENGLLQVEVVIFTPREATLAAFLFGRRRPLPPVTTAAG